MLENIKWHNQLHISANSVCTVRTPMGWTGIRLSSCLHEHFSYSSNNVCRPTISNSRNVVNLHHFGTFNFIGGIYGIFLASVLALYWNLEALGRYIDFRCQKYEYMYICRYMSLDGCRFFYGRWYLVIIFGGNSINLYIRSGDRTLYFCR